jgi:pimeloyl-ACP methyl ester carboxylesterase
VLHHVRDEGTAGAPGGPVASKGRDAMETFESSDGTVIAFERHGSGPAVVLVGGALSDRTSGRDLARLLAPTNTVYCYDRRGRGSSGDSPPYSADLEMEDLEALLIHVTGAASVFGVGTGGSLVLKAAVEGVAMDRIAVYEPPYIVDDSRPHPSPDLPARVRGMIAGGRADDAVERYLVEEAAVSPATVARMQSGPEWATMMALAPTITHDIAIIGDGSLPDALGEISVPTMVLDGAASAAWLRHAARAVAAAIPGAEYVTLEGPGFGFPTATAAPVLAAFLA